MTDSSYPFDFSRLRAAERILLAEDLWDSLTAEQDVPALMPEQQEEHQRRLVAADPGEMTYSSWPDVKRRFLQTR
jgi:putative addiction module component (TIGR02574 family)